MRALLLALALLLAAPLAAQADPEADVPETATASEAAPEAVYPIARGTRLLGGSAFLTRQDDFTAANVSPRYGVFLADGLALGVQLTGSISGTESFGSYGVGVGPEVTYYVGAPGARVFPFVGADVQLTYSDVYRSTFDDDARSRTRLSGGLEGGVMVPVARNVAITGQAFVRAFDLYSAPDEFDTDVNYGLSVGFTTFIY